MKMDLSYAIQEVFNSTMPEASGYIRILELSSFSSTHSILRCFGVFANIYGFPVIIFMFYVE